MFYADYHTHTSFSSDSTTDMIDMVERACSMGLMEIAVTDHIDFDYPDPEYPFVFDYLQFKKTLEACRDIYRHKIRILCGLELGLQPNIEDKVNSFVDNGEFDFIIGSTHCTDGIDLYRNDFYEGKTKTEAYNRYFDDVLNSIKTYDCFNVYGHLDVIKRYGTYEDKSLNYSDHKDRIDEILKLLISKGKGIEINTSGIRYGIGSPHPHFDFVKRYKELGGEIITVGSDAHKPEHIAKDFDTAYQMLKDAGFKYLTVFRNRKPDWINIEKMK